MQMIRGIPLPGRGQGIFTTLVHRVFRLKELDKGIERSQGTFAALDRSMDKLPPRSVLVICDQDVQIAVWKAEQEGPQPAVTAEVVSVRIDAVDLTPFKAVPELTRPGDLPFEAG
jgi:hypothetical protein